MRGTSIGPKETQGSNWFSSSILLATSLRYVQNLLAWMLLAPTTSNYELWFTIIVFNAFDSSSKEVAYFSIAQGTSKNEKYFWSITSPNSLRETAVIPLVPQRLLLSLSWTMKLVTQAVHPSLR